MPCGLMDMAPDYSPGGSRFESWQGDFFFFFFFPHFIFNSFIINHSVDQKLPLQYIPSMSPVFIVVLVP